MVWRAPGKRAQIISVYNFGGRITPEPLAATGGEDGRWIGGSVQQWVDELTTAVLRRPAVVLSIPFPGRTSDAQRDLFDGRLT
jgi:hypothetical protein